LAVGRELEGAVFATQPIEPSDELTRFILRGEKHRHESRTSNGRLPSDVGWRVGSCGADRRQRGEKNEARAESEETAGTQGRHLGLQSRARARLESPRDPLSGGFETVVVKARFHRRENDTSRRGLGSRKRLAHPTVGRRDPAVTIGTPGRKDVAQKRHTPQSRREPNLDG